MGIMNPLLSREIALVFESIFFLHKLECGFRFRTFYGDPHGAISKTIFKKKSIFTLWLGFMRVELLQRLSCKLRLRDADYLERQTGSFISYLFFVCFFWTMLSTHLWQLRPHRKLRAPSSATLSGNWMLSSIVTFALKRWFNIFQLLGPHRSPEYTSRVFRNIRRVMHYSKTIESL